MAASPKPMQTLDHIAHLVATRHHDGQIRRMAAALNLPLEIDPDLALRPDVGARIAGQFWADKSLWKWADRDDAAGVRYRVNGEAMEGLADCRRLAAQVVALAC